MIAMLKVSYPLHVFKQVAAAFTSPDIPKRPESVKELSSIGYMDNDGGHAVFMFDVPDADIAQFLVVQSKRLAFIGARAPGFCAETQVGQKVQEALPTLMPMVV